MLPPRIPFVIVWLGAFLAMGILACLVTWTWRYWLDVVILRKKARDTDRLCARYRRNIADLHESCAHFAESARGFRERGCSKLLHLVPGSELKSVVLLLFCFFVVCFVCSRQPSYGVGCRPESYLSWLGKASHMAQPSLQL